MIRLRFTKLLFAGILIILMVLLFLRVNTKDAFGRLTIRQVDAFPSVTRIGKPVVISAEIGAAMC